MPYQINLLPNERVLTDVDFQVSAKSPRLRLVITNQALLVPTTKFSIGGDAWCFERLALDRVEEVRVQAVKPYGAYAFAAFLAFAGAAVLSALILDRQTQWSKGMAWGLTPVVGAVLLAASAKKRYRLVLRFQKGRFVWSSLFVYNPIQTGRFVWNPPIVIDPVSKKQISDVLDTVVRGATEAKLPLKDERQKMTQLVSPVS